MKKKSKFFLGIVLAVLIVSAGSPKQAIAQVPVPNKQALLRELQSLYPHFNSAQINAKIIAAKNPVYQASYVKQNLIAPGTFEIEGYITFVHNPYDGNMHQRLIIVSDTKNGPVDTAIRIKIKVADGLQKGGHYHFTVKAEPGKAGQQPLELLEFTPLQ